MDRSGNIFSATPSDGYSQGGICPGLGLHISERGGQGALEEGNPNAIQPLKRPRLTPNPSLLLKNGRPYMALGTPGNDRQAQAMLQVLLNLEVHGMEPQMAVEAPRFATYSFPASTHPRTVFPNVLQIEGAYPEVVAEGLQQRGHTVKKWPFRHWQAGGVCLVRYDEGRGIFEAAADHRRDGYAIGL
jgi:gamma-glutamyltranspeptidase/glutathione hydrolase